MLIIGLAVIFVGGFVGILLLVPSRTKRRRKTNGADNKYRTKRCSFIAAPFSYIYGQTDSTNFCC